MLFGVHRFKNIYLDAISGSNATRNFLKLLLLVQMNQRKGDYERTDN